MKPFNLFKNFAILLMMLPAAGIFAQKNKGGYEIKIRVNGIHDTLCYLANYYGDKQYLKDSTRADKNGWLVFKGDNELEGGIYLVVLPGRKYFEFLAVDPFFTLETDTSNYITNMKVKDSEENVMFFEYLNYITPRGLEMERLRKRFEKNKDNPDSSAAIKARTAIVDKEVVEYKKNFIVKNPQTLLSKIFRAMQEVEMPEIPRLANGRKDSIAEFNYYKSHFLDNIDFSDDRLIRTPIYHNKIKTYMVNLTLQIPDSINKEADYLIEKARASKELFKYTVWFVTNTYETSNIMGMDAVFVHMVDKYYNTNQAYWVDSVTQYKISERGKTLKPLLIGKKSPNLTLKDSLGRFQTLHMVNAKYTILVFWDPDCSHCKKEIPKIKDLYDQVKGKGVQVYAVCTEVEIDKWKKFIREHKLDWINVADPTLQTNFRKIFDITSTPVIYFLDDKKNIVAKKLAYDQVGELLERNLNIKLNIIRDPKDKEKDKAH